MANYHPADRPDPSEQPLRARVPDHVSGGAFSTGVIVMTAQTEFILDFVQNLGRPHQIVSRVVMPHNVLPQLVDALYRNMELYRGRWGELPHMPGLPTPTSAGGNPTSAGHPIGETESTTKLDMQQSGPDSVENPTAPPGANPGAATNRPSGAVGGGAGSGSVVEHRGGVADDDSGQPDQPESQPPKQPPGARQASAQEIYDDLKIRDELLSGAYANAVMIGHGPHEFSFDFITNFYPHSAVSARVFLAAGQVPRLYDSLKGTWEQMRARMKNPPPGQPPANPFPPQSPDEDPPLA